MSQKQIKTPREYQKQAHDVALAFYENQRSILLQSPTGSGKTFIAALIIRTFLENYPGWRVFFTVHTDLLFESTIRALTDFFDMRTLNIVETAKDFRPSARIHVMTAQALKSRWDKNNFEAFFSGGKTLLVADEAHLTFHDQFIELANKVLGLTATPKRMRTTKKQLWDLYEQKYIVATPIQLVHEKSLSPVNVIHPNTGISVGLENVPKKLQFGESDYDLSGLSSFMRKQTVIYDNFGELWEQYGPKKTALFCTDINHIVETTAKLNKLGIRAKFLTSEPPLPETKDKLYTQKMEKRTNWLEAYKHSSASKTRLLRDWTHTFDVLVTGNMFTTGVDVPDIMRVADMRPTQSENLYLQFVGRGTRWIEGKVLELWDLSGNYSERHGHPMATRDYPFEPQPLKKKKDSEAPTKKCPQCGQIIPASDRVCSAQIFDQLGRYIGVCGFYFEKKQTIITGTFTETKWEQLLDKSPAEAARSLTKASVFEMHQYWQQKQNKGDAPKFAWLCYTVADRYGTDGLKELAAIRGQDQASFLREVAANTNLRPF